MPKILHYQSEERACRAPNKHVGIVFLKIFFFVFIWSKVWSKFLVCSKLLHGSQHFDHDQTDLYGGLDMSTFSILSMRYVLLA